MSKDIPTVISPYRFSMLSSPCVLVHEPRHSGAIGRWLRHVGVLTLLLAGIPAARGVDAPATSLVKITNIWRFNASKTDLGQNWTAPNYDDSGWASGRALLYVEDSDLPAPKTTALPLTAGSLPTTCYFRTSFILTNALVAQGETLHLVANVTVDDGVVVYLNGAEVLRVGMAETAAGYGATADRNVGNAAWEGPFDLDVTHLVQGINVLAAEVHQVNGTSSDIVMGLSLDAVWQPIEPPSSGPRVTFTSVEQSTDETFTSGASNAADGRNATFSLTKDLPGSYWLANLGRPYLLERVELVNRAAPDDVEMQGLTLRLLNLDDQVVFQTGLTNAGSAGTEVIGVPAGVRARSIWIGLLGTDANGAGNHRVGLAEVRAFGVPDNPFGPPPGAVTNVTKNLASFKPSYMLRLASSVPAASNANDDNYATQTRTTTATVDGYWETDLGATYALYGVRAIAASGISYRLTNAIVRLYDAAHESVFARKLTGKPDRFDMDLNGPVFARYVRVGLEDKQRTDPAGGIEFYIGFREVEVFGRATNDVGILSFNASSQHVQPRQDVTLSWEVEDVRRVEIHPFIGSVGAFTASNGVGSITVRMTNSTEFTLLATNAAGLFSERISVNVGAQALPVQLSEIVTDNKFSLKDGNGQAEDWIELHNPSGDPADLTGWGLSDNPAQPMKWTFPATTLAPHGTLIVFASGRETPIDKAGNLHASFRLSKNGGALVLTARDGVTTVDGVASYPELATDLAYARDLDGTWTFLEPTPGALNAARGYAGWLKPPDWSHSRGFHETGFTLTLTNNSPGATLLYSLDGSEPTLPYSRGLAITRTTAVRAQAVRPGYKSSRIQTETFLFLNDVIASPVMNTAITRNPAYAPRLKAGLLALPSISICVPGEPEYEEREGSLEVLWPDGGEPVQVNCGISRFGNAWTKFAKRSFRMKCRARYGDARLHAPLFDGFDRGVLAKTSFDELDFRSGSQDMVERGFYMAGRFVEDSMLDMGSLNPHGRFVHVYLNGVYWGQYDCRELLVEPFLADYLGGAKEDYVVVRGNDNVGDDFVLGAPEPPNIQPWERVLALQHSYASVRPYLDMSHLVDFMLLWFYGDAESEYRACGPLNAGSGFKFWIADADGFLRTSALGQNRTGRNGPGNVFRSLVSENDSDFKTLLADRIYRHFFHDGALTPAANDARLSARMREIHDSLLAECARWNYRTPANWESAADTIRTRLFPGRSTQLLGYLRNASLYPKFEPPAFDRYGGLVEFGFQPQLTSTNTIYYTLDGNDPRLAGGGVSPSARVWSPGTVTITAELGLNVRTRNAQGQWSALAQPRFWLAARQAPRPRDLLVTEINYHPAGDSEAEFVELWNASTNVLDLSGVSLSNAVRYVFPKDFALAPHEFVVIVADAAAFAERYQSPESPWYRPGLTVAGPWAGALNNAGETLSLVAGNGVELSSVSYQPDGDWPDGADGQGSTLELRDLPAETASDEEVRLLLADPRSWSASSLDHGTPGGFDALIGTERFALTARVDSEGIVLSFPALPGETYRVEYCEDLSTPEWSVLKELTASSPALVSLSDPDFGNSRRFYRLRWLR